MHLMASQISRRQPPPPDSKQMYDGNPLRYRRFMRHIGAYTSRGVVDRSVRLDLLIPSCTAGPRDSIADCIMARTPELGYVEARKILETQCGQEHAIVTAHVKRFTEGPFETKQLCGSVIACT